MKENIFTSFNLCYGYGVYYFIQLQDNSYLKY